MINIGIITNTADQILPFLIKEIKSISRINLYIIFAKSNKNGKTLEIFKERTGNHFADKRIKLSDFKIPIYFVPSHNSRKFYKIIKDNKIKYLYNSGTPNKINFSTLSKVKGVINIHPGILPKYRGCTCPEWTLFNNDALGITAHFMDENYDSGQIIRSQYIKFKKNQIKDYKDLRIRIYQSIINLAKKILSNIANKKVIKFREQNTENSKYYNVITKKKFNKIKIDKKRKVYKFHLKNLI